MLPDAPPDVELVPTEPVAELALLEPSVELVAMDPPVEPADETPVEPVVEVGPPEAVEVLGPEVVVVRPDEVDPVVAENAAVELPVVAPDEAALEALLAERALDPVELTDPNEPETPLEDEL